MFEGNVHDDMKIARLKNKVIIIPVMIMRFILSIYRYKHETFTYKRTLVNITIRETRVIANVSCYTLFENPKNILYT